MGFFSRKSKVERFARATEKDKEREARVKQLKREVNYATKRRKLIDQERALKKKKFEASTTGRFIKNTGKIAVGSAKAFGSAASAASKAAKKNANASNVKLQRASKQKIVNKPKRNMDDFGKNFDNFLR